MKALADRSIVRCVVTGGQTGADQAGWRAAKAFGVPTAGWMPQNFWTEDGNRPDFEKDYGAIALPYKGVWDFACVRERTRLNVERSDVILWYGNDKSPGALLTLRHAREFARPIIVVRERHGHCRINFEAEALRRLYQDRPEVESVTLMVAGNRERVNEGIGAWVEWRVACTLHQLGYRAPAHYRGMMPHLAASDLT